MCAAPVAVTASVLVLAGELDWITPPEVAATMAALFPAGPAVRRPGASHHPWGDDPAAITEVVAKFLARRGFSAACASPPAATPLP
ncbi:alpha/beta fold hydrolase [Amycolatopsis sp. NPDC004368]